MFKAFKQLPVLRIALKAHYEITSINRDLAHQAKRA
jgi:hypothetical protein